MLAFPFGTETADRFAETDSEVDNSLQALHGNGRQIWAKLRKKKLRIAENSRQRIINFVAQDFREIGRQIRGPCGTEFKLDGLRRAQTAFDKGRSERKKFA